MSVLSTLVQTYDNNKDVIGELNYKRNGTEYTLLPIAHSTQVAHIEVTLTSEGAFNEAVVIEGERNTIIPVTERSSGRTSGLMPHPIHDKLMYVAGDFPQYTQGKLQVKATEANKLYLEQLAEWCDSEYGHSSLSAIYMYIKKGTLIEDLIRSGVFHTDKDGLLLTKWVNKDVESPLIYKSLSNVLDAFIRFTVEDLEPVMWMNKEIRNLHIQNVQSSMIEKDICYVTGQYAPISEIQPKKIRNTADQSKLISAQNSNGLTYKGRFIDGINTFNISFEASQKAHNALKWLINRQGFQIDGRIFLVWSPDNVVQPLSWDKYVLRAGEETAKILKNQLQGKITDSILEDYSYSGKANLLILDAATPGRLAVLHFSELLASDYYRRINNYYSTCKWELSYRKNDEGEYVRIWAAPTLHEILYCVFGENTRSEILKNGYTTLLTTVLYGRPFPKDFIKQATTRITRRTELVDWEWEKNLSITCAIINHEKGNGEISVKLDSTNNDRSYLFGRLLAIAEVLERSALDSDNPRATNATRYMMAYSQAPARTWRILQERLIPYQMKLKGKAIRYQKEIEEVFSLMSTEDFNNKALEETYLLGYYSQRKSFYTKKENGGNENE